MKREGNGAVLVCGIVLLLLLCFCRVDAEGSMYIIGAQGVSCSDACHAKGMNCNPNIETNNTVAIFTRLGINCSANTVSWSVAEQPAYVSNPKDPHYGQCIGFVGVPSTVQCSGQHQSYSRLCRCNDPNSYSRVGAFGNALSYSFVDDTERVILNWIVPSGTYGVLTHFWITSYVDISSQVLIRYYIDDEKNASIAFHPPLACGVGFDDQKAPWGIEYFGKGAASGAWFNNFKIPFQRSIRITYQKTTPVASQMFFMIVRGYPHPINSPAIFVGNLAIPPHARMRLFTTYSQLTPYEYVDLVNIAPNSTTGSSGLLFMHSIAVQSGNMQFLEGCYHAYTPYNVSFPGTLMSTGTEDYFDSAWYFNAGEFRLPVSGFTHLETQNGVVTWSAYRFHRMDPVQFEDGFRFEWRNGDLLNGVGQKCLTRSTPGTGREKTMIGPLGSPTASTINAYAWVYTWKK